MRDTTGSAATPAPSCRKLLRGSFILNLPSLQSITRRQERDGVLSGVKPFVCAPTIDWSKKLLVRITSPLGGGDERCGEFLRLVNHHVVTAGEADELPVPIVLVARAELLKRRRLPAGGKHVHALWHLSTTKCELLLECRQRLLDAHRIDPGGVTGVDGERSRWNGRNLVTLPVLRSVGTHLFRLLGRQIIEQRLAVFGHEGIEIDQRTDLRRDLLRDAGDDHASVGMATQHHVRQFLAADDTDDVLNVRVEIDRAVHQMSALAEAGQGRRIDLVPGLAQQPRHPFVAPAAMPGTVNENKGGHGGPLAIGRVGATYDYGSVLSSAPCSGRLTTRVKVGCASMSAQCLGFPKAAILMDIGSLRIPVVGAI